MPTAAIGGALLAITRLAEFGAGFGAHLFMGDQGSPVRLLYTVPDLLNLPGLDVQILVMAALTTQLREWSSTWAKASSWRCFSGGIRTVKTTSAMLWSSVVQV